MIQRCDGRDGGGIPFEEGLILATILCPKAPEVPGNGLTQVTNYVWSPDPCFRDLVGPVGVVW